MTRIEEEKKTVGQMVELYCKGHHHTKDGLCDFTWKTFLGSLMTAGGTLIMSF